MPKENIEQEIENAARTVLSGGVIIYPTDTIWGIGCDATNPSAVEKVFSIKRRAESKSLIVLVSSEKHLMSTVRDIPPLAFDLIACSEKPMTIIYDRPSGIAANALAPDGSLGVRIVNDEFCRRLIERIKTPLVSTSANISGEASPACFSDIKEVILHSADYVVDYRRTDNRKSAASTVIKLTSDNRVTVIRK